MLKIIASTLFAFAMAFSPTVVSASCQDTLVLQNRGKRIFGILNRISGNNEGKIKKYPIAIISHGFNGSYQWGSGYSKPLEEMGWQTFVFDFPGGSVHSRSDNNTMNMSLGGEKSDLMAIVGYFRKQPYVNADSIVLIGESQGGLVSALTASEISAKIAKLVLVYPAMMIPEIYTEQIKQLGHVPDTVRVWNVPIGKKYLCELPKMNAYESARKYKRPTLIIHGDKDNVVPLDVAKKTDSIMTNSRLVVLPGAGHGFNAEQFGKSVILIKDFLKSGR